MNSARGTELKKKKNANAGESKLSCLQFKEKKKVQESISFFFFFLTKDKLQITPLKFKVVWILHAKILEFEFYP